MRSDYFQRLILGLIHAILAIALVLELAGPAWSQSTEPFPPAEDPRQGARDPRDIGVDRFLRRGKDPRQRAKDPRDLEGREPFPPVRDQREVARDTARPAWDAVPVPRLPLAKEVVTIPWQDIRVADLGLRFTPSGGEAILIERIAPDSLFYKVGFRAGDRIVAVNNLKVGRESDFLRIALAEDTRDERLPVVVVRDDDEQTLYIEPALLLQTVATVLPDPLRPYGFTVDSRDPDALLVTQVRFKSPAFLAGLRPGDAIVTFDDRQPLTVEDLAAWIERSEDPVEMSVSRNGQLTLLEWESDAALDQAQSPSTGTTVPDRKRLERLSKLREKAEMLE
jgi:predicted metalloprotease with PDZ domain